MRVKCRPLFNSAKQVMAIALYSMYLSIITWALMAGLITLYFPSLPFNLRKVKVGGNCNILRLVLGLASDIRLGDAAARQPGLSLSGPSRQPGAILAQDSGVRMEISTDGPWPGEMRTDDSSMAEYCQYVQRHLIQSHCPAPVTPPQMSQIFAAQGRKISPTSLSTSREMAGPGPGIPVQCPQRHQDHGRDTGMSSQLCRVTTLSSFYPHHSIHCSPDLREAWPNNVLKASLSFK